MWQKIDRIYCAEEIQHPLVIIFQVPGLKIAYMKVVNVIAFRDGDDFRPQQNFPLREINPESILISF